MALLYLLVVPEKRGKYRHPPGGALGFRAGLRAVRGIGSRV